MTYLRNITPEDALTQALKVSGSTLEDVFRSTRGRIRNTARVLTAWWLVEGAGLKKTDVAQRLKMPVNGVCKAVRIIHSEKVRNPDSELLGWANALERYNGGK